MIIAENCEYDEKESIRRCEVFCGSKDCEALKKAHLLSHTYNILIDIVHTSERLSSLRLISNLIPDRKESAALITRKV